MQDFSMKISMLASGSSGNVTYVETPSQKLLVDVGLTGKKVAQLLDMIERDISDITGILVTHEHIDHVKGVGVLARKYGMPVYANEQTWSAMTKTIGDIPVAQKMMFDMGKTVTIGDIDVTSFGVSHDAVSPQFYTFQRNDKRFVMLTDTGYVSQRLIDALKGADAYLMESNHDIELLRAGSYPWKTKQRILGDKGHLSNEDCALALAQLISDNTKKVYLGHLSAENNMKPIARQVNEQMLKRKQIVSQPSVLLEDTDPHVPTKLFLLS